MTEALDKAAVAQFLEAAKNSLNHLSQLKMAINEDERLKSTVDERELLQIYSRVRRVREYLRRWMSAYPTPDEIQLPEDDLNLLCSCLIHELGRSQSEIADKNANPKSEGSWFEKRKQILSDWTVELATKQVEHLPTAFGRQDINYAVRQVLTAVRKKISGEPDTAGEILAEPGSGIFHGMQGVSGGGAESPPGSPPIRTAAAVGIQAVPLRATPSSPDVVDTSRIRDYRLRLAMTLDVRSYERCVALEDYRIATVLLDAILKGVLIDYGLSNAATLGLEGPPTAWPIALICASVLEREFGDRESALLQLLERSHALLHPAQQLAEPLIVNGATVHEAAMFVARVAAAVGAGVGESETGVIGNGPAQIT